MEFRFGDYVLDLPPGAHMKPYIESTLLAGHGVQRWKMIQGRETWSVALVPGGTLDDIKAEVRLQTRLEIEPDIVSINGIPGVRHAVPGDDSSRVAWLFLKGTDLIRFNLFVNAYVTRAEAESRGSWMQSLRYQPAEG